MGVGEGDGVKVAVVVEDVISAVMLVAIGEVVVVIVVADVVVIVVADVVVIVVADGVATVDEPDEHRELDGKDIAFGVVKTSAGVEPAENDVGVEEQEIHKVPDSEP